VGPQGRANASHLSGADETASRHRCIAQVNMCLVAWSGRERAGPDTGNLQLPKPGHVRKLETTRSQLTEGWRRGTCVAEHGVRVNARGGKMGGDVLQLRQVGRARSRAPVQGDTGAGRYNAWCGVPVEYSRVPSTTAESGAALPCGGSSTTSSWSTAALQHGATDAASREQQTVQPIHYQRCVPMARHSTGPACWPP
jgi:hypothetical protein